MLALHAIGEGDGEVDGGAEQNEPGEDEEGDGKADCLRPPHALGECELTSHDSTGYRRSHRKP